MLRELEFELPLTPTTDDPIGAIADLLDEYTSGDDPLYGYATRLRELGAATLHGYLTGSVDAVLGVGDGDRRRFVVVDYKTNRLGPDALTVDDYHTAAMADEMIRAHYPLQALLYSVALHRYLRWRLPEYTPQRHLGPAAYLFVRGMIGPQTPPGCGVLTWQFAPEVIVGTSDVLAGDR